MLNWCSYCQRFLGETPDYLSLSITHGACATCAQKALDFTDADFKVAESLRNIQYQLYDAGRRNDPEAAEKIIEHAARANIRAVDILIGVMAPMLYQVGEQWKRGVLSVAEEHRFTAYCQETFRRVASKVETLMSHRAAEAKEPDVLLMNAPGNTHTLALSILTLWLKDRGWGARAIEVPVTYDELATIVAKYRPRLLLVSMALAEQCFGVTTLAEYVSQLPAASRPKLLVGGYAVKLALAPAIPGAELMADISLL